jgi:epoxyqueuosine reductase QueG
MNEERENYSKLKEFALGLGASLFGVADLSRLKGEFLDLSPEAIKGLNRGISLGVRLSDKIIESIEDRPTKLYYYHYRQVNYFLDRVALGVTEFIQNRGFSALPIPSSQTIDWENQRGHLSHKEVAQQAGLGWMGRNNLLVNADFGSRIRLVTVLTDFPIPCDKTIEDGCGECRDCLGVCPAGAIKERLEDFDRFACFRQLDEFRKTCKIGHHICGICVKACRGRRK